MLETFNYTVDLLKDERTLVTLYPQGRFQSVYDQPLRFEKGFLSLFQKADVPGFQLVFYAALIDYFSSRKPVLSVYIKDFSFGEHYSAHDLESAYNRFYTECISHQREAI
jgi:hypothetical protein